jgi:hypothetical protein
MSATSAFRSFVIKNMVSLVRQLPPEQSQAVLSQAPAGLIKRIDDTSTLGWVLASETVKLVDTIASVLSPAELDALHLRGSDLFVENPMAQSVLEFTTRVVGLKPKSLIKSSAVTWALITRDCGQQAFRDLASPNQADIVWSSVPQEVLGSLAYVRMFPPSMSIVFKLCNVRGVIEPLVDAAKHEIVFHHVWS